MILFSDLQCIWSYTHKYDHTLKINVKLAKCVRGILGNCTCPWNTRHFSLLNTPSSDSQTSPVGIGAYFIIRLFSEIRLSSSGYREHWLPGYLAREAGFGDFELKQYLDWLGLTPFQKSAGTQVQRRTQNEKWLLSFSMTCNATSCLCHQLRHKTLQHVSHNSCFRKKKGGKKVLVLFVSCSWKVSFPFFLNSLA